MDVAGYAAKKRSQGEEANRGCKHLTRSETVSHPAADRDEDGKTQCVARQDRLHAERSDLEGLRNDWHGRVQDRCVERLHKKRDCNQPREKLLARGRRWVRGGLDRTRSEVGCFVNLIRTGRIRARDRKD